MNLNSQLHKPTLTLSRMTNGPATPDTVLYSADKKAPINNVKIIAVTKLTLIDIRI